MNCEILVNCFNFKVHCSSAYSSHCSSGYFVCETFDSGVNLELGDLSQLYLSVHADIILHTEVAGITGT